ncbi:MULTISPECIES: hypothetical protein [unclassified Nocardiopsis]|uniref:hypothetical protein n=1 Tax=Nocardiopsis TaxID=2013 RepID=UPI00387B8406
MATYRAHCANCSEAAVFEFEFVGGAPVPGGAIGGPEPSRIIDPGEFLWLSDRAASRVPVDLTGLTSEEMHVGRRIMKDAIALLEEVLKFIPEGADGVPSDAFFSDLGKTLDVTAPERFRRGDIEERLAGYRAGLADFPAPFS